MPQLLRKLRNRSKPVSATDQSQEGISKQSRQVEGYFNLHDISKPCSDNRANEKNEETGECPLAGRGNSKYVARRPSSKYNKVCHACTFSNVVRYDKPDQEKVFYPLSYGVPVRERYGSTLLPATREQHDQNCTQSH